MAPVRIENWTVMGDRLVGQVYGHPNFEDGEVVTTTRVAELDAATATARTKNTNYLLGEPATKESK